MTFIPGWNSVEAAAKWHRGFEIAGFVAFGLLLLFEILAYVYGNRKDTLVGIADQRAQQKMQSEIDTANLEVAKARRAQKQAEEQAAPRILAQGQRNAIVVALTRHASGSVVIKASINAPDARAYAEQILAALHAGGWTARVDNAMFTGLDTSGLWITVRDAANPPAAAPVLQQILNSVGLNIRAQIDPSIPGDETWFCIGSKPIH